MSQIPAADASVLPGDWHGCLLAWRHRSRLEIDAELPADQEALTFAMPVATRPISSKWVNALVARPALALPGEVALHYRPASTLQSLPDHARRQVVHLQVNRESELNNLVGAPVEGIRSIHFRDCDDKAQKAPALDLSGVEALGIRGECKSLKRLFAAYRWADKLRCLSLPSSLNKSGRFLLEPGRLPALEELRLRIWINPTKLWTYLENQPPLRHLHINNKVDMTFARRCAALPWWRDLRSLRIEGADMGPRQAMAFLEHPFRSLETLQMETWFTYGGLSKAPKAPAVLRALAALSRPLPVRNLFVRSPDGDGVRALARSRAFPRLERLYIRTQALDVSPSQSSPLVSLGAVLSDPGLAAQHPTMLDAFRHLEPLLERGVRVYIGR